MLSQRNSTSRFLAAAGASTSLSSSGLIDREPPQAQENKLIAELTTANDLLKIELSPHDRQGAIARARTAFATISTHGADFADSTLMLAAEIVEKAAEKRSPGASDICVALRKKLLANNTTVGGIVPILEAFTRIGYFNVDLASVILKVLPEDRAPAMDTREVLTNWVEISSSKNHPLACWLFCASVKDLVKTRAEPRYRADPPGTAQILQKLARLVNFGDATILRTLFDVPGDSKYVYPDFERCPFGIQGGLLKRFSGYHLSGTAEFEKLLRQHLRNSEYQKFEISVDGAAELLQGDLADKPRKTISEWLRTFCEKHADRLDAYFETFTTEANIGSYSSLLLGGHFDPRLHAAFEKCMITRLRSPGRESATTQRMCAALCAVAALVKDCSQPFIDAVVQRADEHMKSALEDKETAFTLMTYALYLAPQKWDHVVTELRQLAEVAEVVKPAVTPEAGRCCYLLRRLVGLPCGEFMIVPEGESKNKYDSRTAIVEFLRDAWSRITRPEANVDRIGLEVGVIDVLEPLPQCVTPRRREEEGERAELKNGRADLQEQPSGIGQEPPPERRALALIDSNQAQGNPAFRTLSEIHEALFARHAPNVRVLRVAYPDGDPAQREDLLRDAVLKLTFYEDLEEVAEYTAEEPRLHRWD